MFKTFANIKLARRASYLVVLLDDTNSKHNIYLNTFFKANKHNLVSKLEHIA